MHKNVGLVDSFVRLTLGLFLITRGAHRGCGPLALFGAMESASGITRFCPISHLLGLNTLSNSKPLGQMFK